VRWDRFSRCQMDHASIKMLCRYIYCADVFTVRMSLLFGCLYCLDVLDCTLYTLSDYFVCTFRLLRMHFQTPSYALSDSFVCTFRLPRMGLTGQRMIGDLIMETLASWVNTTMMMGDESDPSVTQRTKPSGRR
jgi:hypothetical protein